VVEKTRIFGVFASARGGCYYGILVRRTRDLKRVRWKPPPPLPPQNNTNQTEVK